MIESVLNLGIKGADLVISQLEKIQENKEKFSRAANVSITGSQTQGFGQAGQKQGTGETKGNTILKSILDALKKQKDVLNKQVETGQKRQRQEKESKTEKPTVKDPKEKDQKKDEKENSKNFKETIKNLGGAVQGLATLSSGNAIRGVAGLAGVIPFVGAGIVQGTNAAVTAMESFKANIAAASKIDYDTKESESRIGNIMQGATSKNFTERSDLDLNAQRTLAETLAERYGVVQKPLQDAIKELYKTDKGKVDVNQASALASGNFSALGTDKGFFFQKISDQLQGLPPSIQQAMQSSLLQNIKDEDKFKETSTYARDAVTKFDRESRTRAAEMMKPDASGKSPVDNALMIAKELNKLDATLNQNFDRLLSGIREMMSKIPGLKIQDSPSQRRTGTP